MDNSETLATLGTQDTGLRQTKHKNTTQKIKMVSKTDHTKDRGWTQVHAQGLTYLTKRKYSLFTNQNPNLHLIGRHFCNLRFIRWLVVWDGSIIDNYVIFVNADTGRGVVLAKKQFSPTVSFSASSREFPSDFFTIIKGRRTNPSYYFLSNFIVKYR